MCKIKLKNILLTIPLALSIGCATKIDSHYLENTGMLIQNSLLIYEDEYTYTKVGIEKFGLIETQLISKEFTNRLR